MRRREVLTAPALVTLAAATGPAKITYHSSIDASLRPYFAQYSLPALAAAILHQGHIAAAGVAGVRRIGTNIPVTIDDRFSHRLGHQGDDRSGGGDAD
jgi:CubicO group peptidase (beta-lactamase class C family)